MSVYTANVPQSNQSINETQPIINDNFQVINSVYGTDHVGLTESSNVGMHNTVTTPDQSSAPTTTTEPKFFGLEVESATGVMQFSKGPSDAQPTPVNNIQVTLTNLSTSPQTILDLSNISQIQAYVSVAGTVSSTNAAMFGGFIKQNGVIRTFRFTTDAGIGFTFNTSGNLVQIQSTSSTYNPVYVSIDIHRFTA